MIDVELIGGPEDGLRMSVSKLIHEIEIPANVRDPSAGMLPPVHPNCRCDDGSNPAPVVDMPVYVYQYAAKHRYRYVRTIRNDRPK